MKILVTGASGFIGSFIVSEGLERGHQVWAGVRRSSSRQYLQDPRTHFAELDLSDTTRLTAQLQALKTELGGTGWDYVIHAAGATKSLRREGFFRTNTEGTRHLVEALRAANMMPQRLVFISSLSVFGAIKEEMAPLSSPEGDTIALPSKTLKPKPSTIGAPSGAVGGEFSIFRSTFGRFDTSKNSQFSIPSQYPPITANDTPQPNTAYGQSKLAAEQWLQTQTDVPWVILRPTGVYGPRERDYFLMAQSIKQHIDFAVGYKPQEITFVYVRDVVQAVFLACQRPAEQVLHRAYFLSDGNTYSSRAFSDLLQQEMGVRRVLHIKAPLWFLRAVCAVNGTLCRWMGKLTTLNMDKYHILSQRNWNCDIGPARRELGYEPQWPLQRGVPETVEWYKAHGWL